MRIDPEVGFTDSVVDPTGMNSFGGVEIIKWFKSDKKSSLPKVNEGIIYTFKVKIEWMPTEESKYNDRLKVYYSPSAYTDYMYFLDDNIFDDSQDVLKSQIRYFTAFTEILKDDTSSVYEMYDAGNTEYLIKFTYSSLGDDRN